VCVCVCLILLDRRLFFFFLNKRGKRGYKSKLLKPVEEARRVARRAAVASPKRTSVEWSFCVAASTICLEASLITTVATAKLL
jgi:hypothetical protein